MKRAILLALCALVATTAAAAAPVRTTFIVSTKLLKPGDDPVIIGGRLSGRPGREIVVEERPCGFPWRVSAVLRPATGLWQLERQPIVNTAYRARVGRARTHVTMVRVQPSVTLEPLGRQLIVRVAAREFLDGRAVFLERRAGGRGWVRVATARLERDNDSAFGATRGGRRRRGPATASSRALFNERLGAGTLVRARLAPLRCYAPGISAPDRLS